MKKIYLFCLLILAALIADSDATARQLSVRSFGIDPTDITARTQGRRDRNGVLCALVRVALPVEGCKFEGSVVEAVYDTNGYLVYMTDGAQRLRVRCPGTESLDIVFADLDGGKAVESGMTYDLRLEGYEASGAGVSTDPGGNYLAMNVTPATAAGITVFINGQAAQVNNGQVAKFLPYGSYVYEVQAVGYAPVKGDVSIGRGDVTRLNVRLESVMARLNVKAATPGTEISINGQKKGTGSWSGELEPGLYRIDASKESHRPYAASVTLAERDNKQFEIPELTPITGVLSVGYSPFDAEIYIDNVKVGVTPAVLNNVLVGQHTVKIHKNDYADFVGTVNIAEGQTTSLEGALASAAAAKPQQNSTVSTQNYQVNSASNGNQMVNGHEYVDLGLPSGTLWATCDIGASSPSVEGKYYGWGAMEPEKKGYTEDYNKNLNRINKIFAAGIRDIGGNPKYDTATALWGAPWRLPSAAQIEELCQNCKVKRENDIYIFTGPNGKTLIIPQVKGYTNQTHQSSTRSPESYLQEYIKALVINRDNGEVSLDNTHMQFSWPIRPVISK